jgi:hypothetical protein
MKSLFNTILEMMPYDNPYEGFDYSRYQYDTSGGVAHAVFEPVIDRLRPRIIIEVGSWKGSSALHIASLIKKKSISGIVLCVDTWLGTVNNMLQSNDPVWGLGKYYQHGYPTLYYQFLANIIHSGLQNYILPLPTTSAIGARWFTAKGIQADLVYIDGSHEEDDVYQDIVNYWKLLKNNGIMVGDDWHLGGVGIICAVNKFSKDKGIKYQVSGSSWILQKTTAD